MPREPATLRDWLFGASGKRRLIEALLAAGGRPMTQAELARRAGLTPKGTVDGHLAALQQAGLVRRDASGYRADVTSPLASPLRALLSALEALPDDPVERP